MLGKTKLTNPAADKILESYDLELVKILFEQEISWYVVHQVCKYDLFYIFNLLVEERLYEFEELLILSCEYESTNCLKIILEELGEVSEELNEKIIRRQYEKMSSKVLKILIEKETVQIDPTIDDNKLFKEACRKGHINIVRLIFSHFMIDVSMEDNICLKSAKEGGYTGIINFLQEVRS